MYVYIYICILDHLYICIRMSYVRVLLKTHSYIYISSPTRPIPRWNKKDVKKHVFTCALDACSISSWCRSSRCMCIYACSMSLLVLWMLAPCAHGVAAADACASTHVACRCSPVLFNSCSIEQQGGSAQTAPTAPFCSTAVLWTPSAPYGR